MWFSVVCILTKRVRDITVVKMMWTNFDHCEDGYSLSLRVQTTLNHIRFVTPNVSFRAQAEKGMARHIDSSSLVWMDSYRERQISQSGCEISSNCGKNTF